MAEKKINVVKGILTFYAEREVLKREVLFLGQKRSLSYDRQYYEGQES